MILETPRLRLAPLAITDAEMLFPLMSDDRITTFLAWEPHSDVAVTRGVVEGLVAARESGRAYHWIVLEGELVCGLVSLIDVRRTHRAWIQNRAEIAYWLSPEAQGRGLATEATAAIVEMAFSDLHLNRLIISHTSANPASGRVPQKLGFRYVGREMQFFNKNGVWHDMNHYELLAEDWASRRESK